MFILDSLLIGSLRFVLDKVVAAAEAEAQDDTALREQLLEAQMRLELGEISDDEFAEIERDILARIREIKGGQRGASDHVTPSDKITGVDVESFETDADRRLHLLRRQGRRRQDDLRRRLRARRGARRPPRPRRLDRSRALARRRPRRAAVGQRPSGSPRRPAARLRAVELDAPTRLRALAARHRRALGDIIEHGTWLDRHDVDALLELAVPGIDELIGLLEIVRLVAAGRSTCVVVDTAPTGHTLRLLAAPAGGAVAGRACSTRSSASTGSSASSSRASTGRRPPTG